ncbi:MAG: cell envelope integrity protein CreD [Gammaproteobacteria bacterium]|nr:MAG: cell envelope integrity protein CreD [Gammaproteobacteria bacterium]
MLTSITQSITFKVFGIGILALLMLIPLAQVRGLIAERNGMRDQAMRTIAQRWGAAQQVGGPLLAIPTRTRTLVNGNWSTTNEGTEILLADQLVYAGKLQSPEMRHYGIYSTPVYTAELKISGRFVASDVRALIAHARVGSSDTTQTTYMLEAAELRLPLADVRGIRRISAMHIDDKEVTFGPGAPTDGGALQGVALPLDLSHWTTDEAHAFELELTLAGTTSLQFLPLARHTEASLAAAWSNPSFVGAFLPAEHKIDTQGFDARWQVLDLNRIYGQHWQEESAHRIYLGGAAFGVNLYQPADLYQRNERAGKYGVLFIALTFVAFFLFEVLKKLRVHPVQYLLVGLALTTFYVVLLALSEQVGFAYAYLAAAVAVVLMVGGYAAAVLRARRAGALLGLTLSFVYALLYGLVVSEQYSLLMGAIALLCVVAVLMYLTRKVDWSNAAAAPAA